MTVSSPTQTSAASRRSHRPDLATDLRVAVLRLSRRIRSESDAGDLTEAQNCVLAALNRIGPMTPRALAEREQVQPPTMTRTLASLEAIRYVVRDAHPTDGRQVLITLTDDGADHLSRLRRRRSAWLATQLRALTDEERATLTAAETILRKMAIE
ncbi:MarR family transcriptional regulator [Georgenia sp. MJ173]|uniref:MarR family winged helix-turn-helix transcriptional regulator n=1 Tax=Georgenia sunbinii TaxID=3117728 RepID=UPI002F261D80